MRILTDCSFLSEKQIERIEDKYGAKYIFETQLKLRDKWSDFPAAVFYTERPYADASNWFGVWENGERYMMSDAISAVEEPLFGVVAENGDVIYSRHPRDFRESDDKTVFVDGGRDHCRHDFIHEVVKLKVSRDQIIIVSRESKAAACNLAFTEEMDLDLVEC